MCCDHPVTGRLPGQDTAVACLTGYNNKTDAGRGRPRTGSAKALPDELSLLWLYQPQHFLYFLPLPQGQGSFLPILGESRLTCPGLTILPSKKYQTPLLLRNSASS